MGGHRSLPRLDAKTRSATGKHRTRTAVENDPLARRGARATRPQRRLRSASGRPSWRGRNRRPSDAEDAIARSARVWVRPTSPTDPHRRAAAAWLELALRDRQRLNLLDDVRADRSPARRLLRLLRGSSREPLSAAPRSSLGKAGPERLHTAADPPLLVTKPRRERRDAAHPRDRIGGIGRQDPSRRPPDRSRPAGALEEKDEAEAPAACRSNRPWRRPAREYAGIALDPVPVDLGADPASYRSSRTDAREMPSLRDVAGSAQRITTTRVSGEVLRGLVLCTMILSSASKVGVLPRDEPLHQGLDRDRRAVRAAEPGQRRRRRAHLDRLRVDRKTPIKPERTIVPTCVVHCLATANDCALVPDRTDEKHGNLREPLSLSGMTTGYAASANSPNACSTRSADPATAGQYRAPFADPRSGASDWHARRR